MKLHQIKKHMHSKRNRQQNEEPPTQCENIFANRITDKGLIIQNIKRTHTTQKTKPTIRL